MRQVLVILVFSGSFFTRSYALTGAEFLAVAQQFFKKNVVNGMIQYANIQKAPSTLNTLVTYIKKAKPSEMEENEKMAFYINGYNLLVIKSIVEKYPLSSVMDVPGFFDSKKYLVGGENVTLNEIENEKLRKVYHDPRVHFVLVCGALGCPEIAPFVYSGRELEDQLNLRTRKALNDPSFIWVMDKQLYLSELFSWYKADFGRNDEEMVLFINKFLDIPLEENLEIIYYPYKWALNDAK